MDKLDELSFYKGYLSAINEIQEDVEAEYISQSSQIELVYRLRMNLIRLKNIYTELIDNRKEPATPSYAEMMGITITNKLWPENVRSYEGWTETINGSDVFVKPYEK